MACRQITTVRNLNAHEFGNSRKISNSRLFQATGVAMILEITTSTMGMVSGIGPLTGQLTGQVFRNGVLAGAATSQVKGLDSRKGTSFRNVMRTGPFRDNFCVVGWGKDLSLDSRIR